MAGLELNRTLKDYLKYFGPGALIVIISFAVALVFVKPAPPRNIIIGTGGSEGSYFQFGQEFKKILAREGIHLEVLTTDGAVDNLRLLEAGEIDIAFVHGGISSKATIEDLKSLGSLYYEAIWAFYRNDVPLSSYRDSKGLRIGTGGVGSFTQRLAEKGLPVLGIHPENVDFVEIHGSQGADMLIDGSLDFALMVFGYEAPVLQRVLRSKELAPYSWRRVEAIARKNRHLSIVTLPRGIVDFDPDIPNHDLIMLAPAAQLVVRSDFHPALIYLIIEAAREIFSPGGVFEEAGEFPSLKLIDFKTTREIRRLYSSGPSFLRRYFPFWLATFIDRMKIMLVPLVVTLIPFIKIMPPLYRWRKRHKIFRWYRELELLDPELHYEEIKDRLPECLARLDKLEQKVSNVKVPLGYRESMYNLRIHIDMIRTRLNKMNENNPSDDFQHISPENHRKA